MPGPGQPASSGFRHFLQPQPELDPALRFTIDGKPVDDSPAMRARAQELMGRLAILMDNDYRWDGPLAAGLEAFENPRIPAGYTYLLQLVGHDLVQSTTSRALAGERPMAAVNGRLAPLQLDTIYGGGPDVCPSAYAIDERSRGARYPRTALRLGRVAMDGVASGRCPFRDIPRAAAHQADDVPVKGLSEALIPDPRNDAHAFLSQLTVLFHLLHNGILQRLPGAGGPAAGTVAAAYARFASARLATTAIYRNIIRKDLLRLILRKEVYDLYAGRVPPVLDRWDGRMPLEVSHGALRFGHAMVRPFYRVNGAAIQSFLQGLDQSGLRGPEGLPLHERWVVRWSLFFEIAGSLPNPSRRIGPSFAYAFVEEKRFGPIDATGKLGLAYRDLLSAALAGNWSVPKLIAAIRDPGPFQALLPADFSGWKNELAGWLTKHVGASGLTDADIETLSNDPPLPLFVLFEAAVEANGERLGTLGSILLADIMFAAMQGNPLVAGAAGDDLPGQLQAAAASLLGDKTALDFIPDIEDMPSLVRFMDERLGVGSRDLLRFV